MTIQVNIGAAKTRLSELVAASERGEHVVLARAGKPVVRLVAEEGARQSDKERIVAERLAFFGSLKGKVSDKIDWSASEFTEEELDSFERWP